MCASSQSDPLITEAIRGKATDGGIACAAAHLTADRLQKAPLEIGQAVQDMGFRIRRCQLGLFGYSPRSSILTPARTVPLDIRAAIEARVEQNRLSCRICWQIARDLGISRLTVARCAEALKIKIARCQLGVF
jgi:hypothetical protein